MALRTRLLAAASLLVVAVVAVLAWRITASDDASSVAPDRSSSMSYAPGRTSSEVVGRVTAPGGTPVPGAAVRLWSLQDQAGTTWRTVTLVSSSTTADDGTYALPVTTGGRTFSVDADAPGYAARTLLGNASVAEDTGIPIRPRSAGEVRVPDLVIVEGGRNLTDMHLTSYIDALRGTGEVGKPLRFTPPTFDVTPTSHDVIWMRDGVPLDGSAGVRAYVPLRADVGHAITVRWTGYADYHWPAWADSYPVTVTAAPRR